VNYNLDLKALTEAHMCGLWIISQRLGADVEFLLTDSQTIQLDFDRKFLANPSSIAGLWSLIPPADIIYNPRVGLTFDGNTMQGLVTRYYVTEKEGKKSARMILYFTNGVELWLERSLKPSERYLVL
jgi:hypothetical protein